MTRTPGGERAKVPCGVPRSDALQGLSGTIGPEIRERLRSGVGLSPREFAIVLLMIDGHSDAAMAHQLGCSKHTVSSHVRRIYQKLGVRSRAGVVARLLLPFSKIDPHP